MLSDLRIVEMSEGMAAQVAGLMLCELGADVLKIERTGGEPARGTAHFANWNRGKRSLELDLRSAGGLAALKQRLAGADVLLHQYTPKQAAELGLDDATLASDFPQLVVCGITGSPYNHPDVERSNDELLVAARLGTLYENDGYRAGPIVWRYRAGSWGAAYLAASGILARLVMRLQSGKGGPAHTSIMQGYLMNMCMVWGRNSEGPMPNPGSYPLAARPINVQQFECLGGEYLQTMDPTRQFDYATLPTMWDVLAEGLDIGSETGLSEAFRRYPRDAWIADLRAADVAVEPILPMGEMLRLDEVKVNGYVIEIDDPELGRTIQPNLPIHADAPLKTGHPAPRRGEGSETEWSPSPVVLGNGPVAPHPLTGVRVLDLGMFLAGPMAPSMMGDMGADVIKVESLSGDRMRFMHRYFQAAARSKRSLALDLTKPEAQDILERLVKWAEIVHHNMRFKGAAKLGLTEAGFKRYNPDVAFSYVSAYGQLGARGNWPGYDSIFNAVAGWELENAGEGNPPMFIRPGTMDLAAALSCMTACMASLYVKRATGKGTMTQTSLLGISAFSQGEHLILPDGSLSQTTRLDQDQTGFGPYHRIFETGDDWIAIAAHSSVEQAAVRSVFGDDEAGFAAAASRRGSRELLDALEAAGVPCDPVAFEDAMNRFFDEPRNRELGLISVLPHPLFGVVEQTGAFWCFPDVGMDIVRACPTIGEHTDEIMLEMGFTDAEIAGYRERKIIG